MNTKICSDDSDEVTKLECKVVLALSRLQKGNRYTRRNGRLSGIHFKQIVDYLCKNYCYLDGDVEAQVITALLSCVKNGIVCALDSGKYRLVGPSPRFMISECYTRTVHGPKCCCSELISCISKTIPNNCCFAKPIVTTVKKTVKKKKHKPKLILKRSAKTRTEPQPQRTRCVQKVDKMLQGPAAPVKTRTGVSKVTDASCKYCLRIQELTNPLVKVCKVCHPVGNKYAVPYDTFSPREELPLLKDSK